MTAQYPPISSLPPAISLDGSEEVPIVQGGTTKRTTSGAIANTATGFVPTTRTINTPTAGGLTGGGSLASDLTLNWAPANLNVKTAMVVADTFAVNDSSINSPAQITFPNAMKALTGLTALNIPSLTNDYLIINHAADGLTYKINPSSLSLATGNVPAGGTAGQPLVKNSSTNYDTIWATLGVAGGGTGLTSGTSGGVLYFSSTSALASSAALTANQIVLGGGAGTAPTVLGSLGTTTTVLHGNAAGAPTFGAVSLTADVSGILPSANGGTGVNNGSSTITLGGSLTTVGAFASTFTMTGITGVTFPTSGTLATTGGANIPSVAQGDLLYGSATNVLSSLSKDTTATRYLSNTGTNNNPAWAQVALATGVSGQLPLANGGTNANLTASTGGIVYSGASALAILAGTATANQIVLSGSSAAPSWSMATYPGTAAAGTILAAGSANTISATATPTLGIAGSVVGSVSFANATSGAITVAPTTGILGSVTLTLPAATDTFAVLAASQALTNKTYNGLTVTSTTGTFTLTNAKTLTVANSLTFSGTDSTTMTFPGASSNVGYLEIPQNSQSGTTYTLVLADSGKHIYHASGSTPTYTIPANASVAYPIGTALTFVNPNGGSTVTIAITSDTMYLAGTGSTGSRTLAANGIATALKLTSTTWLISGTGLT